MSSIYQNSIMANWPLISHLTTDFKSSGLQYIYLYTKGKFE